MAWTKEQIAEYVDRTGADLGEVLERMSAEMNQVKDRRERLRLYLRIADVKDQLIESGSDVMADIRFRVGGTEEHKARNVTIGPLTSTELSTALEAIQDAILIRSFPAGLPKDPAEGATDG